MSFFAQAQTTIFNETVNTTIGVNTPINSYTGWTCSSCVNTGVGTVQHGTPFSTSIVNNGGPVYLISKNTTGGIEQWWEISNVNTLDYNSITLTLGIYKQLSSSDGSAFLIEVSSDGISYSALTIPALPTSGGSPGWYYETASGAIPSTANLRIRFRNTSAVNNDNFRLDDIKLAGTLTCGTASVGGSISTAATVCPGSNGATLTLSGHAGSVTGWESSLDNFATAGTPIANTTTSLTYSNLTQTTSYRALVKNGTCSTVNSGPVTITVSGGSVGGSIGPAASACSGANGGTMTLTGQTGTITGWESSLDNFATAGTPFANTNNSYNYANLTQTTSYRAIVKNGSCLAVYSSSNTITVSSVTVGGSVSGTTTVCSGTNGATLNLTGSVGTITRWESSIDNFASSTPIANTTTSLTYSNLTQTTSYRAVVQSGSCGSANSTVAKVTVITAPTLSSATALSRCTGVSATYTATSATPSTTFSWTRAAISGISNTAGSGAAAAATETLVNTSTVPVDVIYVYTLTVGSCSNPQNVTVTVNPTTAINTDPVAASICAGNNVSFSVGASGGGLSYLWKENGANLSDGGIYSGTGTATLTLTAVTSTQHNKSYSVFVTGACGSLLSGSALLTVRTVPAISSQPSSNFICDGANANFNVTASGNSLVYQWQENGVNISDGGMYSGTNTSSLSLTAVPLSQSGKQYTVVIGNGCLPDATSTVKTLNVFANLTPTISISTVSNPSCTGSSVTFTSSISNGGASPAYQWKVNGTNAGINASTFTTSALVDGDVVSCVLTSNAGCLTTPTATSNSITMTVSPLSAGGSVSAPASVCAGSNGATINLTGETGSVTGWESSLDNFATVGTPILNTTASLTYNNLTQTTSYRAVVKNGGCSSANSAFVTITVTPVSVGGTVSSSAAVCSGSNGATINLAGETGSVTGWESSLDNFATAGTAIINTTSSLTYSNLTQTTSYRAVVKNGSCASANSSSVTITVTPVTVGGTVSSSAAVCSGTNGATLNLTGETGSVTGWESSLDNFATAGTPIVNTTTSLIYSNLTQTTSYRAVVKSGSCASVNSSSVTITVTPGSVGGTVSSSASVCSGTNGATINLAGETGSVTGWESSLDNFATAGSPIINTTASLTYSNLTQTTSYRAVVKNGGCASVNSTSATITVSPVSVGGTVSSAATVCSGTNGATINLTGEAGSVTGWESSLDNFATAGAPIVNTTTSLTYNNLTQTTSYRAVVKSGSCASVNSSSVTITVTPGSVGGTVSSSASVCSGTNGATITLSGETGSVTGWESSLDNFATAGTPIVNTTTGLTYSNITQTTSYRAIVKNGGCSSVNSASVTITVTPGSVGGTVSSSASVCSGTNGATINLAGETGSVTGWESSLDNFATAGTPIINTTTSLTYSNLTQTTSYRAVVKNGSCASVNSTSATITVSPVSVGGTVSSAATVCSGTNGATINLAGETGSVTAWESSLDNFTTAGTAIVNTTSSLTYSNLTQTTSYRAVVKNGSCASANSSSVTITVTPVTVGGTVSSSAAVCSGTNGATLNLTGETGSVTGWESSLDNFATAGTPIVNTTTSLTYSNLTQTTSYRAVVKNGSCASVNSTSATITVSPVSVGGTVSSAATVCSGTNGATINLAGETGSVTGWESSLDNFATAGTAIVNTTTSLTYSNLTQTTSYRAVVKSGSCASDNSTSVTITVTPVSAGGTVSSPATVCSGANGATINLTGETGSVTGWESSLDNFATAGTPIVNTTTSLTFTNLSQTIAYRANVQNGTCPATNSTFVTITVISSVGGSVSSASTVCSGTNGGTINLTGETGSITGWEFSLDNFSTAGTPVINTTSSLTYSNLTQTTSYRTIVKNGTCTAAVSSPVTITVTSASIGGTLNSSDTVCSGSNGATISLTGESGNVIGWESSLDNFATAGTPIVNTTTNNLYSNLTQTTSYRAIVQASGCSAVNSSSVTITVTPVSVGGTVSSSATVCSGANGSTINLAGESGSVIGWESSLDNFATAGTPIGNTTTSLTYNNLTQTTSYRAVVKSAACPSDNSSSVTITVTPGSIGGSVSSAATECTGANGATINLAGETGSVTGWESSLDNFATAGTPIVNTTTSLTYTNITQTTSYRAIVANGSCTSANSSSVTITVTPVSAGGTVNSSATVCSGTNGGTVNLTGETGSVTGWESSLDNFTTAGTPIANTTPSLTYNNLTQTTSYRAVVKSGTCPSANSLFVVISVTPASVGGTLNSSATVPSGSNGATINLTGETGSVSGWESSLDNFATAGTPIANTTTSLTYSNLTQTTSYRAIVATSGCSSVFSSVVTITVTSASVGGSVSSPATVCSGSNGAVLTLNGETGSVIRWESSLDNFATAGTSIANTTNNLTYSNLTQTTSYRAVVQNGGSASVNSSSVTITVTPVSSGGSVSASATVCAGSNGATLNLTGHTGNVTGWESSLDNFTTAGTPIANTSASLVYSNLTQTTSFRAIIQNGSCVATNSSSATISVTTDPSVNTGILQSSVTVINGKNSGVLTLTGYSSTILNWESSLDNFANSTAIINNQDNFSFNNLTQTTYYRVALQGLVCPVLYSNSVTVTVIDSVEALVIYPSLSPNDDNVNDEWVIDNITKYPHNKVSIFDRWGNIVFKESEYNNKDIVWKGYSNAGLSIGGKELPDGTYYYIVDLGDGSKARSGYVVIKR